MCYLNHLVLLDILARSVKYLNNHKSHETINECKLENTREEPGLSRNNWSAFTLPVPNKNRRFMGI